MDIRVYAKYERIICVRVVRIYLSCTVSRLARCPGQEDIGAPGRQATLGTYHLHGKTGNLSWKIKWFAPFRLERFRKYGLWFEVILFFCTFKSLWLMWNDILYSDSLSRNMAVHCLIFMPEISNQTVFVNGKHPCLFNAFSKETYTLRS